MSVNIIPLLPECFVLLMVCVTLMVSVFSKRKNIAYYLVQLTLIIAAYLTWWVYPHMPVYAFDHGFVLNQFSVILKLFIYVSVFFTLLYSERYVADHDMMQAEYYILALLSTLGMMVLVSAGNLITLYMGLELMSLPIYAMVAMRKQEGRAIEAAMKYFILGALSSGMLLFGMSFLFGVAGSLDIHTIATQVILHSGSHAVLVTFAAVFVLAGIAFKLGAAPFHMWAPDVYDGAPTSVTLFISAAPKIAAFALAIILLRDAFGYVAHSWQDILIAVSLLSMAIGNIVAITQTNIKRMLAYSSIAHMGYMVLGIIAATTEGYASSMFYIISYAIMSLAALGMITVLSRKGKEIINIEDLAGLNQRHPWVAFLLMLVLFSMAGIPPLVGFIAKVGVLEALISVHLTWLAVVAIVFAVIGSYYYLRVVKVMYFEPIEQPERICMSLEEWVAITINCLAVLFLGIFPGALFALCHAAF